MSTDFIPAILNANIGDNFASEFPFGFPLEKTIHSSSAFRNEMTIKEVFDELILFMISFVEKA